MGLFYQMELGFTGLIGTVKRTVVCFAGVPDPEAAVAALTAESARAHGKSSLLEYTEVIASIPKMPRTPEPWEQESITWQYGDFGQDATLSMLCARLMPHEAAPEETRADSPSA